TIEQRPPTKKRIELLKKVKTVSRETEKIQKITLSRETIPRN
ncbi:unnamed protein product, partial [Tenebrio molitor]